MKSGPARYETGQKLLEFLNRTYNKLHTEYEEAFWISYMGDHSVDAKMNRAEEARDAFRANAHLKAETERLIRSSKGETKHRLELWSHFFSLYQAPPEALAIKKRVGEIETRILAKRAKRKEGYIDPKTKRFVKASDGKMRVMIRTHPDEAIRKTCFESLEKVAVNDLDEYVEIIKGRNEFARVLGYEDFYDYRIRIDENMSKRELFSIFEKIYAKTKFAFKNARKLEKTKPGLRKPWNFAYMMTGDFTKEEDPYFQFENVLSYWGRTFAALGISFKGGRVTLDLLDRKGKWNNGFCHYPTLVSYRGRKRLPGSANFTSNAVPGQVGSGVHGINTVFHEGGHAADRLNSLQRDACVNHEYPPATVSWAETQSMFMDTISDSIEWRMRYARTASGKPYPFSLFERRVRALHLLRPLSLMHIMFVVFFEKEIYECRHLTKEFVLKTARKMHRKYFDRTKDSVSVLNVPHIYSWETSAYYHGYGIAELGVAQWREYFFKKYGYIVDNPKVGKELSKIWSYASIYPAKELIRMATGEKLSPKAFLRNATLALPKVIDRARNRVARLKKVPEFKKPVKLDGTITMVHGKKKIADNRRSFEVMDRKYRAWLKTVR